MCNCRKFEAFIGAHCTRELADALRAAAARRGITASELMRSLLAETLRLEQLIQSREVKDENGNVRTARARR